MRKLVILICISFTLYACQKNHRVENTVNMIKQKNSPAEAIASAYGLEHWKDVTELSFTFNVDRDSSHFERSWVWKPKKNEITLITKKDTISYNRTRIDSSSIKADQGFINDKYWLLAPFNLVWDKGVTISTKDSAIAPISTKKMQQLTIVYDNQGGYTPGDAYDFYYDSNFIIKEWVFRKSNAPEPSMMTTWEAYEDFNGIRIAKTHTNKEETMKLYFTDIKVTKE